MKKKSNAVFWGIAVFYFLMAFSCYMNGGPGILGGLLCTMAGVMILPVQSIRALIHRKFGKSARIVVPIISVVLFYAGVLTIAPASAANKTDLAVEAESAAAKEESTAAETKTQTEETTAVTANTESPKNESGETTAAEQTDANASSPTAGAIPEGTAVSAESLSNLPAYSDSPYAAINGNVPDFSESDKARTDAFETYSDLDPLGRCGVAYANVCREIMPTEKRGNIGSVKPTGWHTIKYDIVDGKYLYNRCHLIAYELAGENANTKNLITGTRYMNVEGMLPFENMVADYVKETNNHVLYRVTPVFRGSNLVASGVQMEAWSVEDQSAGICFNVFCYNVQPGITIDYATGDSGLNGEAVTSKGASTQNKDTSASLSSGSGDGSSNAPKSDPAPVYTVAAEEADTKASETAGISSDGAGEAAKGAGASSEQIVYVAPKSGKKYHYDRNCRGLKKADSIEEMTESEAKAHGYGLCGYED